MDKLAYPKVRVDGKLAADKTRLECNAWLTLEGIPPSAHEHVVGTRSGVDWLVDRYRVKTDKASGIMNDPNDWAREQGDPRYIVDLVGRVVALSVRTVEIVGALPRLDFSRATRELAEAADSAV